VKNPSGELRLDWRPTKVLPFARYECDETAPVCQSIARITTDPDAKLRLSSSVPWVYGSVEGLQSSSAAGWVEGNACVVEDFKVHTKTRIKAAKGIWPVVGQSNLIPVAIIC